MGASTLPLPSPPSPFLGLSFTLCTLSVLFLAHDLAISRQAQSGVSLHAPPKNASAAYLSARLSEGILARYDDMRDEWIPSDSTLLPKGPYPTPVDILIFGDSVDRYLVKDGCLQWGATAFEWADGVLLYTAEPATLRCVAPWGTMSSVHLYGAAPTGPYAYSFSNNNAAGGHEQRGKGDFFVDTQLRIPKALELYEQQLFKLPDVVVYQSSLWDAKEAVEASGPVSNEHLTLLLRKFRERVHAILDQVLLLLSRRSGEQQPVLLLRTTPVNKAGSKVLPALNAVMRNIGKERQIGVVDWDAMMHGEAWSNPFRDTVHPSEQHNVWFHRVLVEFSHLITRRDQ